MAFEPSPVVLQTTIAAPTATTSLTAVMLGLGASPTFALFIPQVTGRVMVFVSGVVDNTNGNGCEMELRYGPVGAPANGAAAQGTAIGLKLSWVAVTGALRAPFCMQALITGLSVPKISSSRLSGGTTQYYVDLAFNATTAGTCTITNANVTAFEV